MSDSDWRPNVAIGALVALVVVALFALVELHASTPSGYASSPTSAEQSKQESDCQATSERYYDCRDLIAQEGVMNSTDAIVMQGERQFWLSVINLALLIGTFAASIVATFMAVEAVNVSRQDYEGGEQPLLRLEFDERNWDPEKRTYPEADAQTTLHFINDGKGVAFIDVVWVEHFVFERNGAAPPPVRAYDVKNFRWLPHGVVVPIGGVSQFFDRKPREGVSHDTFHALKDPVWVLQGFVLYRSITGGLYQTGFSYYWDTDDKCFYLGPVEGQEGRKYNFVRKLDRKQYRREGQERLFESQQ